MDAYPPLPTYPMISVDELLTLFAPYNPRTLTQGQFEALQRSIDQFGFVEPVVVNRATSRVVGGHQRARAAQALGLKEVPVFYVDLPEEQEKALNVALNRISGDWDHELLTQLLEGLDESLLDATGFDEEELQKLLSDPFEDTEAEAKAVKEVRTPKYTTDQLRDVAKSVFPMQYEVVNDFLTLVDEREAA